MGTNYSFSDSTTNLSAIRVDKQKSWKIWVSLAKYLLKCNLISSYRILKITYNFRKQLQQARDPRLALKNTYKDLIEQGEEVLNDTKEMHSLISVLNDFVQPVKSANPQGLTKEFLDQIPLETMFKA